jgi:hypothetical protein
MLLVHIKRHITEGITTEGITMETQAAKLLPMLKQFVKDFRSVVTETEDLWRIRGDDPSKGSWI